jgi:hypothetical protein
VLSAGSAPAGARADAGSAAVSNQYKISGKDLPSIMLISRARIGAFDAAQIDAITIVGVLDVADVRKGYAGLAEVVVQDLLVPEARARLRRPWCGVHRRQEARSTTATRPCG